MTELGPTFRINLGGLIAWLVMFGLGILVGWLIWG